MEKGMEESCDYAVLVMQKCKRMAHGRTRSGMVRSVIDTLYNALLNSAATGTNGSNENNSTTTTTTTDSNDASTEAGMESAHICTRSRSRSRTRICAQR